MSGAKFTDEFKRDAVEAIYGKGRSPSNSCVRKHSQAGEFARRRRIFVPV